MHRVLLVDDSATDRTLLKGLLAKEPTFEVECATSGREAIEMIVHELPSVVVTDMQMPEMDGLELVTALRARFPQIPVVLITGQGSEALAAKALRRGAAGYVPKSQSAQLLRDTVRHVISLAEAASDHGRLLEASTHVHFDFELANDPTLIGPLQDLAQRMAGAMGVCDSTGCLQLGVALEHAVSNAMYHGNLKLSAELLERIRSGPGRRQEVVAERLAEAPYRDRLVRVSIDVTREEVQIVVSDDGEGFDVQEVTNVGLSRSLNGGSGQGLFLMWAFMDKVTFDRTGAKVTLVKHREETVSTQAPAMAMAGVGQGHVPAVDADDGKDARTGREPAKGVIDTVSRLGPAGDYGVLVGKEGGRPIRLTKRRVTIGRLDSCDLVLNHPKISHHHCVLCLHQGWWFVKDLHSKNGTKVNHIPVVEHVVRPGNTLTLGSLDFELRYSPHELGAIGITPPPDPF